MEQLKIWGIGSYFSQIWRSAFNDGVPFYPLWYNQFLNRKLPVIIDTNNLMLVCASVPLLRTVIDKKAELLMNCKFKIVDNDDPDNGNEYQDDPVFELLHAPNALQNHCEFIQQWCVMRDVYATSLIYKNKANPKAFPKSLWVLPTGEMKINPTGLLFEQMTVDEIISNYEHINNQFPSAAPRFFQPWEIMRYIDGPTDRYYFGISKIVTNKLVISNIQQALTTRNVLLSDMGARGILSNNAPDAKPIGKQERKDIERDYRHQYGNSDEQMKIIITNSDLKWQAITVPTKDLMAFEEVDTCLGYLCDMYGIQKEIFSSDNTTKPAPLGSDGAGKVQEAMKVTYESTIQIMADEFCRGFNRDEDFGLKKRNRRLIACFKHLPIMKEDEVSAATVDFTKRQAYAVQTTSMLSLIAAVKSGQIDYDSAVQMAINIQCLDPKIVKKLITKPTEIIPPPALIGSVDDTEKLNRFIEIMFKPQDV